MFYGTFIHVRMSLILKVLTKLNEPDTHASQPTKSNTPSALPSYNWYYIFIHSNFIWQKYELSLINMTGNNGKLQCQEDLPKKEQKNDRQKGNCCAVNMQSVKSVSRPANHQTKTQSQFKLVTTIDIKHWVVINDYQHLYKKKVTSIDAVPTTQI